MRNEFDNKEDDIKVNIEDEIAKSLERVVWEETNVAKAFVDNQKLSKADEIVEEDNTKTQVLPRISKDMLKNEEFDKETLTDISNVSKSGKDEEIKLYKPEKNTNTTNNTLKKTSTRKKSKKKNNNTKYAIALLVAVVAVVLIVVSLIFVSLNNQKKKSYKYNYDLGVKYYEDKNYDKALDYLVTASKANEGKRNLDLKYMVYECYSNKGDNDKAAETLRDIISYNSSYKDALSNLAKIYYNTQNGEALNGLIDSYKGTKNESAISAYIVEEPIASKESGEYDDSFELELSVVSGKIYYTTDGTEPTKKSTLYKNAFEITTGTTVVKAIAVNDIGVISQTAEFKYVVEYGKPVTPDITPASGSYEKGQKIVVNNLPENCKAYYTLDGTIPTNTSNEYTGEFDMPEGNTVISMIFIDAHEQVSSIAKRNYVVKAATSYTYDQALNILKNRLIADSRIMSDGKKAADGSLIEFVYHTKTKINDKDMYIVRYDVTKNGSTSTEAYYGIAIDDGSLYKLTLTNGSFFASKY